MELWGELSLAARVAVCVVGPLVYFAGWAVTAVILDRRARNYDSFENALWGLAWPVFAAGLIVMSPVLLVEGIIKRDRKQQKELTSE